MKTYLFNVKRAEFLKAGGAFFFWSESEKDYMTVYYHPAKQQYCIDIFTKTVYETNSMISLVRKCLEIQFERGFKIDAKHTRVPKQFH